MLSVGRYNSNQLKFFLAAAIIW